MIPMKFASMGGSGGSSFDPANPGAIGGTTPSTGAFTRLSVAQGTLTDPVTGINLSATWNDAADTFRGLEIDVTDTASAAGSTLIRASVGGESIMSLSRSGVLAASRLGTRQEPTIQIGSQKAGIFTQAGTEGELRFVSATTRDFHFVRGSDGLTQILTIGTAPLSGFSMNQVNIGLLGGVGSGICLNADFQRTFLVAKNNVEATLQLGLDHATTATAQRIQAHGVTTGTGASLTLGGGSGSVAKGDVILDGGNRSVYIASPSATEIRDILISHGLMAAS
jgi:hypothetical protein